MISNNLKKIYEEIHKTTPFGKRAKEPEYLKKFISDKNPKTILDFGCGKGNLVKTLQEKYKDIKIYGYDPANPEYDIKLPKVDLIISTDVLEHIEYTQIDETLNLLCSNSKHQYHLISCGPAKLILPDGRNAHLIQESPTWWKEKFRSNGCNIIKEDYREFEKFSKKLKKNILVKNYFVMVDN